MSTPNANIRVIPSIVNLPAELELQIFEQLDPVDSTCLGLTCTKLQATHRQIHGIIPLWGTPENDLYWSRLRQLLRGWMRDAGYVWGGHYGLNFIRQARLLTEQARFAVYGVRGWKIEGRPLVP